MAVNFTTASSQYLDVASVPDTTLPITMACWMRSVDVTVDSTPFWFGDAATISDMLGFYGGGRGSGSQCSAYHYATSFDESLATANPVNDTWHHLAGTFVSSTSRYCWLDGVQGTEATAAQTDVVTTSIDIGRQGDVTPGGYMGGDVAECAIWDVELSSDEIKSLANGVSPLLIRPNQLLFYTPLTERQSPSKDLIGGLSLTWRNTPQPANHPRIFMPKQAIIGVTMPAAGGGTTSSCGHPLSLGLQLSI